MLALAGERLPDSLPPPPGPLPLRPGRLQNGLGAGRADPLARARNAPAPAPCTWAARWRRSPHWEARHTGAPFVLLAQPSLFDPTRAPAGKHTAWAYCHVPNGSTADMTDAIESQVERFAPGFRGRILARTC